MDTVAMALVAIKQPEQQLLDGICLFFKRVSKLLSLITDNLAR